MKTKLRKIFSKKNLVWLILLLIIIVSVVLLTMVSSTKKIVIKRHDLYYYLLDVRFDLKGKITMNQDNDITQLSVEGEESVYLESSPVYYKDEPKTIFPKNMNIVFPISGKQYKANYYSTIHKEVEDVILTDRNFEKVVVNAIMYDGGDTYYLLDKSVVTFNNETFELGPMSYIVVDVINDSLYIYDYDKDEIFSFTNLTSNVIISTDMYKINATLDLFYFGESSRLLIRNIDALSNIK